MTAGKDGNLPNGKDFPTFLTQRKSALWVLFREWWL